MSDLEIGRVIYEKALRSRRGFREDQLGIDLEDEVWNEIFENIGQVARSSLNPSRGNGPGDTERLIEAADFLHEAISDCKVLEDQYSDAFEAWIKYKNLRANTASPTPVDAPAGPETAEVVNAEMLAALIAIRNEVNEQDMLELEDKTFGTGLAVGRPWLSVKTREMSQKAIENAQAAKPAPGITRAQIEALREKDSGIHPLWINGRNAALDAVLALTPEDAPGGVEALLQSVPDQYTIVLDRGATGNGVKCLCRFVEGNYMAFAGGSQGETYADAIQAAIERMEGKS